MQGKDAKKNRKEKKVRTKDNKFKLFDYNNTLETFSFIQCSNHCRSDEGSYAIDERDYKREGISKNPRYWRYKSQRRRLMLLDMTYAS